MAKDVIVACDFAGRAETLAFLDKFEGRKPFVKIGMELFYAEGPDIVREIKARGHKIFLDLKLHDIPRTVERAVKSCAALGVDLMTIHASGGKAMIRAAKDAAAGFGAAAPKILAVTLLTSLDQTDLADLGVARKVPEQVQALGRLACSNGADGIVCSPMEVAAMRALLGPEALFVTPGVRPAGAAVGDIIYFGNLVNFKRLDIYMEGGTPNTNSVYEWEGYVGGSWVSLTETDGTNNGKAFGKSGKVTWTETLQETTVNGITAYWVRARITTLGASAPKASHIQVTETGATGFDSLAEFMSSLVISIYRKRGDGNYAEVPADIAMPFTQCILYRNVEISDLPAWTDIKIGFKLSDTPTASISIPYTGYAEIVNAT